VNPSVSNLTRITRRHGFLLDIVAATAVMRPEVDTLSRHAHIPTPTAQALMVERAGFIGTPNLACQTLSTVTK